LVVYIMEAHPINLWQSESNEKEGISVTSPTNVEERIAVAGLCMTKLSIKIPAVIDDMDNTTQGGYAAHPDRLYVIDRDGRIAYKSQPGPFGFKAPEMAEALKQLLPTSPASTAR
jgi:type I thyroxine 5'-deiodinase